MKSNETIRYFPFSPGIPWKVKNGRYVVPHLSSDAWVRATKSRDIILLANGGLVESFVSLSLFEILNYASTTSKLMWAGNRQFESLVRLNGLASVCPISFSNDIIQKYPVPLFLDKSTNTYFNYLNNYIDVKTFYGEYGYRDCRPIAQQLTSNFIIPWEKRYLPQYRNSQIALGELDKWSKLSRFQFRQPYICIFPDRGLSQHKQVMLGWNDTEVKALAAMLRQVGISTLVFTNNSNKYYASPVYTLPTNPEYMLLMIRAAKAVLADEVDPLIIAEMISSAKIVAKPSKNEINLHKNRKFLKSSNVIHTLRKLTPVKAFNVIYGGP